MRPEANLQRWSGRSYQGFSGLLASSGSLVASLQRWKGHRRNHIRHHQPQELIVRESGAGPGCYSGPARRGLPNVQLPPGREIRSPLEVRPRPGCIHAQPARRALPHPPIVFTACRRTLESDRDVDPALSLSSVHGPVTESADTRDPKDKEHGFGSRPPCVPRDFGSSAVQDIRTRPIPSFAILRYRPIAECDYGVVGLLQIQISKRDAHASGAYPGPKQGRIAFRTIHPAGEVIEQEPYLSRS